MRTLIQCACVAALLAGCADEKKNPDTAYDTRAATTEAYGQPNGVTTTTTETRSASAPDYSDRANTADRANAAGTMPGDQPAPGPVAATPIDRPETDANGRAADNSGVNTRDRNNANPTAMDQGGSESDRNITAEIRKAVVNDGSLSFTAKNVKIITKDGNVTLRGPVKTEVERAAIQAKAAQVAGAGRVTNQLEVAK